MDAAGIVADHASQGAAVVGSGVGGEGEVMFFGGVAEVIEDDSGLYAGDAAGRVDFEDLRHVLGEIEDDGDVAALSGEGRASAAAEQGSVEFAAEGDGGEDVVGIVRENYPDGDLAVIGAIGSVESAGTGVKADFAANLAAQGLGQPRGVG
jgi:hypothetical protein